LLLSILKSVNLIMRLLVHHNFIIILALASMMIASCDEQFAPPSVIEQSAPSAEPTMIPRAALFKSPVQYQGRISPNGAKVSWLSWADGALNLFVANSADPASARQYTHGDLGVLIHYWSPNSAYVLFTQTIGEEKHSKTFSLNVQTFEVTPLGPKQENIHVKLEKVSSNWPDTALVSINDRDPKWPDLYRINLRTGKRKLVHTNPGFYQWVIDEDLIPRIGIRLNDDRSKDWVLLLPDGATNTLFTVEAKDTYGTRPLQFDPSGTILYMLDRRGRDHSVYTSLDLLEGTGQVLAHVPGYSINRVLFHPVTARPLAWAFNEVVPQWVAIDDNFTSVLELAAKSLGPNFHILATTSDMQRLVLYSDRPDRPGKYSLLERSTGTVSTMFETAAKATIRPFSATTPVAIPARDGFSLIGYFSPADRGALVVPGPAPLVILPQPAPGSRMFYGYDPQILWLNSRGIGVLEINTRGAGNLGSEYYEQSSGTYLQLAVTDMIDAANWAVADGLADANKVSALGTGFAGALLLRAIQLADNPFACVVTLDAMVDIASTYHWYLQHQPEAADKLQKAFQGPQGKIDQSLMKQLSPIHQKDLITTPLLMLHSDRLPGVTREVSWQYAKQLAANQTPVTFAAITGDFEVWYENTVIPPALAISELFFAQCLQSQVEPFGAELDGVAVTLPIGSQLITGLAEALGPSCCQADEK